MEKLFALHVKVKMMIPVALKVCIFIVLNLWNYSIIIGPCEIKANFDICITSTRVSVYYDIFEKSCLPAMPGTCATNRNNFLGFVDCASVRG